MFYPDKIVGKYVTLRSVDIDDALFTLEVRNDEKLTRYLPRLNISLEQQIAWIKKQKEKPGDYLFVAENMQGKSVGVLGVYDVENNDAETGRLAMIGNPLETLEAQYLSWVFAFKILELKKTHCFIYKDNSSALRLSLLFGTIFSELTTDEKSNYGFKGTLSKEAFLESEPKIKKMLRLND